MRMRDKYPFGLDWITVTWFSIIHAVAVLAFFFVTPHGIVAAGIGYFTMGCLGVNIGFHRLLTHGSFQTYRPLRWLLAVLDNLAGEGSVLHWVMRHRQHHEYSDQPQDPHSPQAFQGTALRFLWSHVFWMLQRVHPEVRQKLYERYVRDLSRDAVLRVLDGRWVFIGGHIVLGLFLYGLGFWVWDAHVALSLVLWALFLRMVIVFHATWAVNSIAHMFGYQNYRTRDNSRNNFVVAVSSFGEGWHNNHHKFPTAANHGQRWWELDLTYYVIRLLAAVGLAWNVHTQRYTRQLP